MVWESDLEKLERFIAAQQGEQVTYITVIADHNLAGVYRSLGTARRRIHELMQYPIAWLMAPQIGGCGCYVCNSRLADAAARAASGYWGKCGD